MNKLGALSILAAGLAVLPGCADVSNGTANKATVALSHTSSPEHTIQQIYSVLNGVKNITTPFVKKQNLEIYLGQLEGLSVDNLTEKNKEEILTVLAAICTYVDEVKDDLVQKDVADFITRVGVLSAHLSGEAS